MYKAADNAAMRCAYYFRQTLFSSPGGGARHGQARALPAGLRAEGRTADVVVREADLAFPTKAAQQELLDRLREFATRHKVALAQLFGSRKHGFCYLPSQFLLVSEGQT